MRATRGRVVASVVVLWVVANWAIFSWLLEVSLSHWVLVLGLYSIATFLSVAPLVVIVRLLQMRRRIRAGNDESLQRGEDST